MMSAWDSEDEPSAETPRGVRKKGPPRHATRLNPGPGMDIDYTPFSKADVETLIRKVGYPLAKGTKVTEVEKHLNAHARIHRLRIELDRQPTDRMMIEEFNGLERSARDLEARLPLLKVPGDPLGQQFAPSPAHGLLWPLRHHLPEVMADRAAQRRKETARSVQRKGVWTQEEDASLTEEARFGAITAEDEDLLRNLSEGAAALASACAALLRDAEQRSVIGGVPADAQRATALKDTVNDLLRLYAGLFGRKATISKDGITRRPSGPTLRFVQGALLVMGVETSDENILRISRQEQETKDAGDAAAG